MYLDVNFYFRSLLISAPRSVESPEKTNIHSPFRQKNFSATSNQLPQFLRSQMASHCASSITVSGSSCTFRVGRSRSTISESRDLQAAGYFIRMPLKRHGRPNASSLMASRLTVRPASPALVRTGCGINRDDRWSLSASGRAYLNKRIEQDHRRVAPHFVDTRL